jgi:hypothetical protein
MLLRLGIGGRNGLEVHETLLEPFPQTAVVQEAKQFRAVHCVQALQQRAFKEIFVFHGDGSRGA